jgi:hypothetical protein
VEVGGGEPKDLLNEVKDLLLDALFRIFDENFRDRTLESIGL